MKKKKKKSVPENIISRRSLDETKGIGLSF